MRWSEIETLKFVKLYLRHENLWNPSDVDYKMKNKRQKAYNDIIHGFHCSTGIVMSETELKIKIKNLRSTYTQEVSKIRERSSPDFVYTPTIKWFAEWHSCFSAVKKRMDSLDDEANNEKNVQYGKLTNSFTGQSDDYLILLKAEPDDKHIINPGSTGSVQINCSNSVEDEFDIYGKYLAAQLRSMDLYRALRIQLEIQSIVSKARISSLSGT